LLIGTALQSGLSDSADDLTHGPARGSGLDRPEALRVEAAGAIDHKAWTTCIELLDEAKALDPAGDEMPAVKNARRLAQKMLNASPPAK
jgi:hypothetical protein